MTAHGSERTNDATVPEVGRPVDLGALLEFLDGRRRTSHLLVGATLDGLAERVRRGEFDVDEATL